MIRETYFPRKPVVVVVNITMGIIINSSENVLARAADFRLHVDGMRNNMQTLSSLSYLLSHQGFNRPLLSPKIEVA